jgi:hypothetical protein
MQRRGKCPLPLHSIPKTNVNNQQKPARRKNREKAWLWK